LGEIVFEGQKPKRIVAELMRHSSFLVLTSQWENQPVVLLEAMACGLPVIAPNVGGVPEVVKPFCGLLITPGDINHIVGQMINLINNLHNYSSSEISLYASQAFSYTSIAKKFDVCYQMALE
jgi:glycosyltransferase involved in cell wall biosynthesis